MKILRLDTTYVPTRTAGERAIIFDLDNTLYTNPPYAAFQEKALIARLGRELGFGEEVAAQRIAQMRGERKAAGIPPTSLGNLFVQLGIDMATNVRWREECIDPSAWLARDERLDRTLERLAPHFRLALVSNNPGRVVEKSLSALGVQRHFGVIVGLDDTFKSKPEPDAFILALRRLKLKAGHCLSIGDRMDVDITPALELGMDGILVDGVEDVYCLPELLIQDHARARHLQDAADPLSS